MAEYQYFVEFADVVIEKSPLFIALLNEVFPQARMDRELYKWKHIDNPSGPSIVGWCENSAREVVGFRALWSQGLVHDGKGYLGFQPCDTATKREYRGSGVFARLFDISMQYAVKNGGDAIFNFPNRFSFPLYRKLGWSEPHGVRRFMRVVNVSNILSRNEDWRRGFVPDLKNVTPRRINFSGMRYSPHSRHLSVKINEEILDWRFNRHPRFTYDATRSSANELSVFRLGHRGLIREAEFAFVSSRGGESLREASNALRSSHEVDCISIVANNRSSLRAGFVPVPSSINFVRKIISSNLVRVPFDLQPMQIDVI